MLRGGTQGAPLRKPNRRSFSWARPRSRTLTIDMRRLPPKYDPEPITQSDEETNDPLIADHRNF